MFGLPAAQAVQSQNAGQAMGLGEAVETGPDDSLTGISEDRDSASSMNPEAESSSAQGLSSLSASETLALEKTGAGQSSAPQEPVESDLTVEALASYGHYKIFASGSDCKLYTAGVEYDRHSWGSFLKARMDYVGEFLPVVLLYAPVTQDIWGTPTSPDHHIVPGVGMSPIGFRMLWRDKKAIKPYLLAKGGLLLFPQKVLSQEATYIDFSLQSATGVQVRMNDKWDLRLGLFSDFHFSDAFIVPVNPGLDVMNANVAMVYHFGTRKP